MEFNSFGPAVGRLGSDSSRGGANSAKVEAGGWAPLTLTTVVVCTYHYRSVYLQIASPACWLIMPPVARNSFSTAGILTASWCRGSLIVSGIQSNLSKWMTRLMDIICLILFRHSVKYKTWISGYSSSGPSAIHLSGFDCTSLLYGTWIWKVMWDSEAFKCPCL